MDLQQEFHALLREDEAVLQFLENQALDGVWFWDLEHPEDVWLSEAFWQGLGYGADVVSGKSQRWRELAFAEDVLTARLALQQHLDNPSASFEHVVRYRHADGATVWVRCRGMAVRDASGKPRRVIGTHSDISELKRNEQFLNQCNEAARIGFWEVNLLEDAVFWSAETKRIHGVPVSYQPSLDTGVGFYEEGQSRVLITQLVREALISGKPYEAELTIVTAQGEQRWVKTIGIPELRDGQCVRLYGTFQDIDSHKRRELALAESRGRLSALFNSSQSFMGLLTPEGTLFKVNDTALQAAALQPEDVLEKPFWDCYWWQISEQTQERLRETVSLGAAGKASTYETAVWVADQAPVTILFSLTPISDQAGKVTSLLVEGRPIQELVDTRARYQSVIEGTNVGTWEWNVQTGATRFNKRWAEIVGYSLAELEPINIDTWQQFAHPDDLSASDNALSAHFSGQAAFYDVECRMRHRAGHWVWVRDRGKVISWDAQGRPLMMYGTHEDITERKQQEEALRESEEMFRNNFRHAGIGMALVGLGGEWLQVNARLCAIVGYSESELLSLTFQDITYPDDLELDLGLLNEVIAGQRESYEMRKRYRHKQGHLVYVLLAVSVARNVDGSIKCFISQVVDVTKQQQAQDEAAALLRIANDQNQQLRQLKAELEQTNAKLLELSLTDSLTGVRNRRAFDIALGEEISRQARAGESGALTLVMIDVDHFKRFNDDFGHPEGDQVLVALGEILQRASRPHDIVARLGGEEFCLLLPDTRASEAAKVAERLRMEVEAHLWLKRGVTISLGIAQWHPGVSAEALVRAADTALYQAKAAGRNRVMLNGLALH